MKTVQKMPCTCMQRMNQLKNERRGSKRFAWSSLHNKVLWQNFRWFKYPLELVQSAQNQKRANRGGLEKLLKIKIGAKVMLTVNIEIQDCLINGKRETTRHIEFAQGSVLN